MYAVDCSNVGRYQVSSLNQNRGIYNLLIRAVQGYSGRLGRVIKVEAAFVKVQSVATLVHYTRSPTCPPSWATSAEA